MLRHVQCRDVGFPNNVGRHFGDALHDGHLVAQMRREGVRPNLSGSIRKIPASPHVLPRFFTDHYDHPIYEGGVQLIDMIYLRRQL